MSQHLQETVTLNNGVDMPKFGLGVYKVDEGKTAVEAVKAALENGYRSIDTASFYENEVSVGQGIKESGVARESIFLTSKVWNDEQGYESTLEAFERSLQKLDTDYLDLYLIHWPVKETFIDTWKALEKLYHDGRVRAIGVSNFHIQHLERLLPEAEVVPAINQVEFHPHLTQEGLRMFCEKQGIQLEAWSPLKRGQLLDHPTLVSIGEKYGKSVAQVILRWDIQHNVVTIPKSITPERIIQNADIFDFELTEEEMKQIDALNENSRSGSNPDDYDK
ncbi:aldo/keto reductase [Oceanobacillus sp. J11TS1]|uniref:aldo/keto reductase n=1 Tax=Oceanobacillus sp. J11TS1 TaxID=2807191 RepID=UPI001B03CF3D|nr:aldo/keto reductase [Oceanobacillus sp. J11TS1]GIO24497.1 glyoxal reductase [Oceanobacillus sp. J11TS1]